MSFLKAVIFAGLMSLPGGPDFTPPPLERPPVQQEGVGTWYGDFNWHGDRTANGDTFRPYKRATCAHKEIPLGTTVLVEHPPTGRSTWCRVTDRGPYAVMTDSGRRKAVIPGYRLREGERWHGVLDMSAEAAQRIGTYDDGMFRVEIRYWSTDPPARSILALGQ